MIADADGVVREQDEGNNRARRVVVVQDADLYLTHPFFSPDGDGVQDDTSFAWRTQGVTSVKVTVSNSRGQLVRTLATHGPLDGSVTWDGRDERGRLLWDGTYTFTLRSERGTLLGRRQVVLDTNHSPIHDAAGTGLVAVRNMTCALPDLWVGPAWLPAEDEALFILNYGTDSAGLPARPAARGRGRPVRLRGGRRLVRGRVLPARERAMTRAPPLRLSSRPTRARCSS